MNEQIGNKINDKSYIKLTPFKGWVLENFPFIESDFDCITNYQLLCKIVEYLNNVISNQNQVQELGTELVNAYNTLVEAVNLAINSFEEDITGDFNDLKNYVDNYFDNNFPELVSNKLDEMAEDGTLENLLNDVAHLTKSYDTYTSMIEDSSTFTNGLRLKTLGYYEVNDGGSAEYIVTNTVDVTKYQVELSNSLYLELIINDIMNVSQFGIKGDNTDETTKLQIAVTQCNNKTLIIDKNILISNTISLLNNIEIKSIKGKIHFSSDLDYILTTTENINNNIKINGLEIEKDDSNFTKYNRFIYINRGNANIENCIFRNYGTAIHNLFGNNLYVNNCYFYNVYGILEQYGYGINTSALYNTLSNNKFINENSTNGRHAIYLNGDSILEVYINNLYVKNWYHNPINIAISNSTTKPLININDCTFDNTCINAPGSNPESFIGNINVSQPTYGILHINNIVGYNLRNCLIASDCLNVSIMASNLRGYYITSTSTSCHFVYIRDGANHKLENLYVDNTNDSNFKQAVYIRDTNAYINSIYEIGSNGTNMVVANNADILLGLYSTSKTPTRITGTSTITPISLYSN